MEGILIEGTAGDVSSAKKHQSKKGAPTEHKGVCLGKVCIRDQHVTEAFVGNNTIYGLILFNIGCVLIASGIYNTLTLQFGKDPETLLFFAVVFFALLLISGIFFKRFNN